MKRAMPVVVFASILGMSILPGASKSYRSFQLVYHSDTRGFYNPCG